MQNKNRYVILLSVLVLVFSLLFSGCDKAVESDISESSSISIPEEISSTSPESTVEPTVSEEKSLPPAPLLNIKEWFIQNGYTNGNDVELDSIIEENHSEDNVVAISILNPSAWPSALLADRIPEYLGQGAMAELLVIYPKMSTLPRDIYSLTISIANNDTDEFDNYTDSLSDYGFKPVSINDADIPQYALEIDDTYDLYANEYALCAVNNTTNGALGIISVAFYPNQALEQKAIEDMELLNFHGFAEKWDFEQPYYEMDQLFEEDDKYGRTTASRFLPSAWPSNALGNIIPQYKYFGVLYETVITYPQGETEEDVLIASVYITEYDVKDISSYIEDLKEYGFCHLEESEYTEHETALLEDRGEMHIMIWPGIRCYIGTLPDDDVDCLLITVRFDGRYYSFL